MPYAGEVMALSAALLWSAASIPFTYSSRKAGAIAVNTFKTTLGSVVLLIALSLSHGLGVFFRGDTLGYLYLALSGWIGLSIADCLLFYSYTLIGPRLAFLIFSTIPFFTALLAWPLLGETLGWTAIAGITVTMAGILLVTLEKAPGSRTRPPHFVRGMGCAGLAALGMALTSILAKIGMKMSALDPFPAHVFRMAMGAGGLLATGVILGSLRRWASGFLDGKVLGAVTLGTCFGPVFGVWFFLLGISLTRETGVAMTLSSLSPVLVIPFTWVFHGDRPGKRAILGAVIAVGGVGLLFFR